MAVLFPINWTSKQRIVVLSLIPKCCLSTSDKRYLKKICIFTCVNQLFQIAVFFVVNRRLKTTRTCQCRFAFQPVDISFWNRTQSFHFQERYSSQIRSLFKMTSTFLSTSTLLQVYIFSNVWGYILEIAAVVCSLNSVDLLVCAEKLVYLFFLYLIHHNLRWMM